MNRREKILAGTVGLLFLVVIVNFGAKRVIAMFTSRSDRAAELDEALTDTEVVIRRGEIAKGTLSVFEERSLPSDPVLANSRYRAWLHEWAEEAGITNETVKYIVSRRMRNTYDLHTFTVTCQCDLRQMVRLLFSFYAHDSLHRIKALTARPLERNQLSLSFTIDAVSIPTAALDKQLPKTLSQRLAFDRIEDYLDTIVGRNPYAPANRPPKFASASPQRGYLNQMLDIRPKAEDPEKGRLTYGLKAIVQTRDADGNEIPESDRPRFEPGTDIFDEISVDTSGVIRWQPAEKGEFEFLVSVADDGLPTKEDSQIIRVTVSDPPPPRDEPPPARPSFDVAKYTFVTGIVERNGQWEVWLTNRTDGQWLRRLEGETIQIGSFEGKVHRIHARSVEILAGDTLLSVRYGQCIADGQVLANGRDIAASGGE